MIHSPLSLTTIIIIINIINSSPLSFTIVIYHYQYHDDSITRRALHQPLAEA